MPIVATSPSLMTNFATSAFFFASSEKNKPNFRGNIGKRFLGGPTPKHDYESYLRGKEEGREVEGVGRYHLERREERTG